ncbi:MAG: hypothetical protein QXW71_03510 [Thermoplasmata archaeon]
MKTKGKGFSIIEVVIGIVLFMSIFLGFIYVYFGIKNSLRNDEIRLRAYFIANGIKEMARKIIDYYRPICSQVTTNTDLRWGWLHPNCNNIIIFPILNNNTLTYTYNELILGSRASDFKNEFISLFGKYCKLNFQTNQVQITCPDFIGFYYCVRDDCNIKSNLSQSVHTAGTSYNYVTNVIKSLVIEFDELGLRGQIAVQRRVGNTQEYNKPLFIDFSDFYYERNIKNMKIMLDIYNTLKKYEVIKRIGEIKQGFPNGLLETDDFYIPWVYQITASNKTNAETLCSVSSCSNLQNNSFWNRNISNTNMYYFLNNLISFYLGDSSYLVDAYGNPLGLELLIDRTKCSKLFSPKDPSNPNNCIRLANPPYPQPNYASIVTFRPPFVGYVYSEFCFDLTNRQYDSCRMPIVYSN